MLQKLGILTYKSFFYKDKMVVNIFLLNLGLTNGICHPMPLHGIQKTYEFKTPLMLSLDTNPKPEEVTKDNSPSRNALGFGFGLRTNTPLVNQRVLDIQVQRKFAGSKNSGTYFTSLYAFDRGMNDITNLTTTLVIIAYEGSNSSSFKQPLTKLKYATSVGFFHSLLTDDQNSFRKGNIQGFLGLGFVSQENFFAQYDPSIDPAVSTPVSMVPQDNESNLTLHAGWVAMYSLNSTLSLKINNQHYMFYDDAPQYDPSVPTKGEVISIFSSVSLNLAWSL